MEGFTYTNIFETKGIEYLIIIAFFAVLIPFWLILNKKVNISKQIQNALGILKLEILKIPQGVFYNKNHTWAYLEKSGNAKIGIDDLLLHLIGNFNLKQIKNPGDIVKKGEQLIEIEQNGKSLSIHSPVSGKIVTYNPFIEETPELITNDPFGNGWIYKVKPTNWIEETRNCFLAENAMKWSSGELQRFKDFLAASLVRHSPEQSHVVLQEGGEICDNPLSQMDNNVWKDFQHEFLDIA